MSKLSTENLADTDMAHAYGVSLTMFIDWGRLCLNTDDVRKYLENEGQSPVTKSVDPNKQIKCEILSWARVIKFSKTLAGYVKDSDYKIDVAVAIARGGFVPARILSDYLSIRNLTAIKVEHWGVAATETEKAILKYPLNADIKDKNVLLVDDITDTGDTLRVSLEYLKSFEPKEIRTAVLIHKTCSVIIPDHFVRKVEKWKWIIFPWHIWEDLTGFVKKILGSGIRDEDGIRHELEQRYGIKVNAATVRDVLLEIKRLEETGTS